MASTSGRTANSLGEYLSRQGYDFDFFQAVRLMLRLFPRQLSLGESAKPQSEVVRFRSRVTLEFPASAIHEIRHDHEDAQPEMIVSFMGLTGTQGVLPFFYTEWMLLRATHKDSAMAAFFDLFHHRWISLFYRAWEKHRLPIAFEKHALGRQGGTQISRYAFDLVGLGTNGLQERLRVKDSAIVYYAGLFAQRPRSASALCSLLKDFFGVPCEIRQFCGAWYELDDQDRCYLDGVESRNQLGNAVLGDAVWDPQSRFEVNLGPLDYREFGWFLPEREGIGELNDLVRLFAGVTVGYRVRLTLRADEVPPALLADDATGTRLGWDIWLAGAPPSGIADDAVFEEAA